MLDVHGLAGRYCFVYIPIDFKDLSSYGYAFTCFVSHTDACAAKAHFQGFRDWRMPTPCHKECDVVWCDEIQGLDAHVAKYRNIPLMHSSIPDEVKPAIFVDGRMTAFPAPTTSIRKPRIRRATAICRMSTRPSELCELAIVLAS